MEKIIRYGCGFYAVGFAIFHLFFWKIFNWKKDLKSLTLANRAIIQIANLRLIYFFLFVASICFVFPQELVASKLGNWFMIGISLFCLGRTIEQFIFLWINNTMVHVLTLLFIIGAILFALPILG